jgi:hypothetical protein
MLPSGRPVDDVGLPGGRLAGHGVGVMGSEHPEQGLRADLDGVVLDKGLCQVKFR